jgi:DNA-directed RNA polymerase specialized sigma24 family protein
LNRDASQPSAEAVEQARVAILKAYRRRLGEAAHDIASEAIARALQSFDVGRSVLFGAWSMLIARNVAKEHSRTLRRDHGDAPLRALPPDVWAPLLNALPPTQFALWFSTTRDEVAARGASDVMSAIAYAAHSVMALLQQVAFTAADHGAHLAPGIDKALARHTAGQHLDGALEVRDALTNAALHPAIVAAICDGLTHPISADNIVSAALSAIGVKGAAFDRWLGARRERVRRDKTTDTRLGYLADQTMTLAHFLKQHCEARADAVETASSLRQRYERLCKQRHESPISPSEFGKLVATLDGVTRHRTEKGNEYRGIGPASKRKRRPKKM